MMMIKSVPIGRFCGGPFEGVGYKSLWKVGIESDPTKLRASFRGSGGF